VEAGDLFDLARRPSERKRGAGFVGAGREGQLLSRRGHMLLWALSGAPQSYEPDGTALVPFPEPITVA
jgi:hypothetical protein